MRLIPSIRDSARSDLVSSSKDMKSPRSSIRLSSIRSIVSFRLLLEQVEEALDESFLKCKVCAISNKEIFDCLEYRNTHL
ncbi:hypothetical protein DPMN_131050 [Dreissena polymorpha]|uniref:Uncharacterized protein n=1 Tax=Dreissena polymorpha TaxID=45954 RepID=A0A9D4H683_DREPO|nr:hypothetical protein DPMN_131050 [Dreissena polymorpha]